jgi:hypothetical protein
LGRKIDFRKQQTRQQQKCLIHQQKMAISSDQQQAYDPDTQYDTPDQWDAAVAQSQSDWAKGLVPPITFGNADPNPTGE